MKRMTLLLMSVLWLTASAQTAREEIRANKYLSGSNYLDYNRQLSTQPLTPAPKGYVPFYMSHYGRHGSRWLISTNSYTAVTQPLEKASKAGKLTDKGAELLQQLGEFQKSTVQRLGDLTTVGERQHHGIGRRMVEHFPELFLKKDLPIDARSTTVNRCILSMVAECEELNAANPTARIHNDVSDALQFYLNQPHSDYLRMMRQKGLSALYNNPNRVDEQRLMKELFNDQKWVKEYVDGQQFIQKLFDIVTNMQSHDDGIDLFSLFTEDELYGLWQGSNAWWYISYANAPQSGNVMAFSQRNLLRNIIETADTVTQQQATLRFGHEVCVLPLACLLELDSCAASVDNLTELDTRWRNYKIFPMGCNIQLVFYRPKAYAKQPTGSTLNADDVLVKALLNEREARLPIPTTQFPYYKWKELRQYYIDKLAAFDAKEQQAMAGVTLPDEQYRKYYRDLPVDVKPVRRPTIPANEVNLKDVGGKGDGLTLNTEAFAKAISKLTKQGGGRLVVPRGVWLTGPIMLKDSIELHLQKNAVVVFSPDKSLYVDSNPKASRAYACIRASKRKNIAITGEGILDGNGEHWRAVKRSKVSNVEWYEFHERIGGIDKDKGQLFYPWDAKAGYANIADSPERQDKLRNDLIRLTDCENVLIEGVTVQNAPKFHVHPLNCRNVIVDGVTVRCPWNAQNGDAIDFSDVNVGLIVNCVVDAGDDGLCLKSGNFKKNAVANGCEDIVVEDNTVYHAHGGFVLGSETISGIRRVVVRNNTFSGTDTGLRFKSGIGRGGRTEQLYISDIMMTDIKDQAIVFQCDYVDRPAGSDDKAVPTFTEEQKRLAPDFQDIHISRVKCRGTHTAIKASGIEGLNSVHDIDINHCTFVYYAQGSQIDEKTAQLKLSDVILEKESSTTK